MPFWGGRAREQTRLIDRVLRQTRTKKQRPAAQPAAAVLARMTGALETCVAACLSVPQPGRHGARQAAARLMGPPLPRIPPPKNPQTQKCPWAAPSRAGRTAQEVLAKPPLPCSGDQPPPAWHQHLRHGSCEYLAQRQPAGSSRSPWSQLVKQQCCAVPFRCRPPPPVGGTGMRCTWVRPVSTPSNDAA